MGERVVETERLRLPHPELHRRAFVLRPLADVAQPTLIVPGKGPLGKLLGDSDSAGIHRLLEAV
jgi:2-amino-4-hydroxy-6-hydroxymethyldihydropteridine diphosphokinase